MVCEQDSIYFDGTITGAGTIYWTFPGGLPSVSSQEDDTVFFTVPGVFNVKMKSVNGCGSDSVSIIADVYFISQLGNISLASLALVFPFISLMQMMSAGAIGGATTSSINVTPTATTQYWSVASNGNCQGDTGYVTVTHNLIPTVVANATPDTVCLGEAIYFSMTGSNAITYDWKYGDLTTSTIPNGTHTYTTAGVFTATLRGVYGICEKINTTQVVVVNCTGLEESALSRSVVVYPNPASHYLNISFLDESMGNVRIDMINSTGKLVLSKEIINRKNLEGIDLNDFFRRSLPPKVYFR